MSTNFEPTRLTVKPIETDGPYVNNFP